MQAALARPAADGCPRNPYGMTPRRLANPRAALPGTALQACRNKPGCNAWTFCWQLDGCGSGCSTPSEVVMPATALNAQLGPACSEDCPLSRNVYTNPASPAVQPGPPKSGIQPWIWAPLAGKAAGYARRMPAA